MTRQIYPRAFFLTGRFDRQVLVDRPDLAGRLQILEIYATKVKLDSEVDIKQIATRTPGFAGADLTNLVNEAALLAARNRREKVTQADFNEAIAKEILDVEVIEGDKLQDLLDKAQGLIDTYSNSDLSTVHNQNQQHRETKPRKNRNKPIHKSEKVFF